MIRSVQHTAAAAAADNTAASGVQPATAAGKKFADVHKAAVAKQGTASAAAAKIAVPDGETWGPASGDGHYARIISGPRAGQYINLTRGERRGETFTIEQRAGKTMHVYGSGSSETAVEATADELRVAGKSPKLASRAAADQPPKGETWAPVDGHGNYADILSGKRNGLFVNISGGVRDGMAFQLVKHGEKTYHVYGSGKDRQVIEVGAKKADSSTTTGTPASATQTTSGTNAGTTAGGTTAGGGISTRPS